MALNQSVVNRQYSPTGVNFPDGLRIGSFNMGGTNTVGLGVPVGNTQVYSIKPVAANGAFTSNQVVLNNNYMTLNVQPFLTPGAATIVDNSLKFDVPRVFGVKSSVANETFSARISTIDRYGQKQVFEGDAVDQGGGEYLFRPFQGVDRITSIYLYNMSNETTCQFSLVLFNYFDLPYCDVPFNGTEGDGSRVSSINLDGVPLIQITTESVAPYPSIWQGGILPSYSQGPTQNSNNTTRPQFLYVGGTPLGSVVLAIQQTVDQYGWTFNGQPFTSNVNNYENRLRALIGPEPYSVGWTDWKG
jgi:hypothetical protein